MKRSLARLLLLLTAVAPIAWSACGPADDGGALPAPGSDDAERGKDSAPPGSPQAELWLDDLRLGGQVGPDGAVTPARAADDFAVGETVYVSMAVSEAPADAAVHVVYEDSAGATVAEDAKKVRAGASYLYFDSGDTRSWPAGSYQVVVDVGGEQVAALDFTLTEGPASP